MKLSVYFFPYFTLDSFIFDLDDRIFEYKDVKDELAHDLNNFEVDFKKYPSTVDFFSILFVLFSEYSETYKKTPNKDVYHKLKSLKSEFEVMKSHLKNESIDPSHIIFFLKCYRFTVPSLLARIEEVSQFIKDGDITKDKGFVRAMLDNRCVIS